MKLTVRVLTFLSVLTFAWSALDPWKTALYESDDPEFTTNDLAPRNQIVFYYYPHVVVDNGVVSFTDIFRMRGSPDQKDTIRNHLHIIYLSETDTSSTVLRPDMTIPSTDYDGVAELVYNSPEKETEAILKYIGKLKGFPTVSVYAGKLELPKREGIFYLGWRKYPDENSDTSSWAQNVTLDISCSDGIFCNGPEYLSRRGCIARNANPCHFGKSDCSKHECLEAEKMCSKLPRKLVDGVYEDVEGCDICGPQCKPRCRKAKCGSGGCPACTGLNDPAGCTDPNFCGTCPQNEECVEGECQPKKVGGTTPGSCANPYSLFESDEATSRSVTWVKGNNGEIPADFVTVPTGGIQVLVEVTDVSNMEDSVQPKCQQERVQEHVFKFVIQETQGVEIMMISNVFNPDEEDRFDNNVVDSLLAIHQPSSTGCEPIEKDAAAYSSCSDDATPPGDVSSRVFSRLEPGEYTLIASFYAPQSGGPYFLMVKFTDSRSTCFPQCDGKYCGSDECQIDGTPGSTVCGLDQYKGLDDCTAPLTCLNGKCGNCDPWFVNSPDYESTCGLTGRCGEDQCGFFCNKNSLECAQRASDLRKGRYAYCEYKLNKCITLNVCDHSAPTCKGRKTSDRFCGSDCEQHTFKEKLPDLAPEVQKIISDTIIFDARRFSGASCTIVEGCLGNVPPLLANETFERVLMRFTTDVVNLGYGFKPPSPETAPNIFEYSGCHGHYHFKGLARFSLLQIDGSLIPEHAAVAVQGGKLAYCMEDSVAYFKNFMTPCTPVSTCADQGIQYGWVDRYPEDLDCQWVVLDEIENHPQSGQWYIYRVCTNIGRAFFETTFDNNCRAFPVFVPSLASIKADSIKYKDYMEVHKEELCPLLPCDLPFDVEFPLVCEGVQGCKA